MSKQLRFAAISVGLCSGLLFAGQSHAGLTGLSAGAGIWKASPSGTFRPGQGSDHIDIEDDLQLNSSGNLLLWLDWDHLLPAVPNLQVRYTRVSLDGSGTVNRSFNFRGLTIFGSEDVDTEFELDQLDLIAYYGLWLPLIDIDLGLNFKVLDGQIQATRQTTGETERVSFTGVVPLLWARAETNLPFTGSYMGAEIGAIAYSGNSMLDTTLRLVYRNSLTLGDVGVELGWKRQQIRLDDFDGTDVDVRLQGPYAAATLQF